MFNWIKWIASILTPSILLALFFKYTKFKSYLFPRPIFSFGVLKVLRHLTPDYFKQIIELRMKLEKRFGYANAIPIILFITKIKREYEIRENIAIYYTEDGENAIIALHEIFDGNGFNVLVLHDNDNEKYYTNLVQSITNNYVPVLLLKSLNNIGLKFCQEFESHAIGFKKNEFNDFINKMISKIIVSSNTSIEYASFINTLYNQNYEYGVYFICQNNAVLNNKIYFLNAFLDVCYNSASSFILASKNTLYVNKFISKIIIFIGLFSGIITFIWSINIYNKYERCEQSIIAVENFITNPNQIKTIITMAPNLKINTYYISKYFYKKQIVGLRNIYHFLLLQTNELFKKEKIPSQYERYTVSPYNTKNYLYAEKKIHEIVNTYTELAHFIGKGELTKYHYNIKESILDLIDYFIDIIPNSELFILFDQLTAQMDSLNTNTQVNLLNLLELINQVKGYLREFNWNQSVAFKQLLSKIEKLPNGNEIIEQININMNTIYKNLQNKLLQSENIFFGYYFIQKESNIQSSNEFNGFIQLLHSILQEPILHLPVTSDEVYCDVTKYCYWNIDQLDYVLNNIGSRSIFLANLGIYNIKTKNFAMQVIDNHLKKFIKSGLGKAQSHVLLQLSSKISNFLSSYDRLNNIIKFYDITLQSKYTILKDIINNNLTNIANDILDLLDNTIFTQYKNIANWNGQNLPEFLFNCNENEVLSHVHNSINQLKIIRDLYILPILDILHNTNIELYKKLLYFVKQINLYESKQPNIINDFEVFLCSLKDWKIIWREYQEPKNTDDFFLYHKRCFEYAIKKRTNALLLAISYNQWNEIKKIYNIFLKDTFPFNKEASTYTLTKSIYLFIETYRKYRNNLFDDMDFYNQNKNILEDIDKFNKHFELQDNNIIYNIDLQCCSNHVNAINNHLISKIIIEINKDKFVGDNVSTKYFIDQPFSIQINIAKKGRYIINNSAIGITTDSSILFQFASYGYFSFVEKFRYKVKDHIIILRIPISIIDTQTNSIKEIVVFFEIKNMSKFFVIK